MKAKLLPNLLLFVLLFSCGPELDRSSLCAKYFEPYIDLISDQARNDRNQDLLDAMSFYSAGDHERAVGLLEAYLKRRDAKKAAHLYLACSYLATGKPFEAELQLDKLEQSNVKDFKDQTEWYTVLCWLCSDQVQRAHSGAINIANAPRHAYKQKAKSLEENLRGQIVQ